MNTSSRYASLLPLVVFLSACASVSDAVTPSAVMLGEWSYASAHVVAAAPDLNTGLRVQISIDSLDGMRFWGRVTLWFVGDVGITPSAFGRVSGTVDGSTGVTLLISRADERSLMVMAELTADVLTVHECLVGAEPGPFAAGTTFLRLKEDS